jgi:hypothetical protein
MTLAAYIEQQKHPKNWIRRQARLAAIPDPLSTKEFAPRLLHPEEIRREEYQRAADAAGRGFPSGLPIGRAK